MLKVVNINKKYGDFEVLKDISFEIKKGTIYGFLGPNGAGKTTTMNILSGLIDFNGGEIHLDGGDFKKNKRQLLRKVGYLPQNPVFYNYMSANEYLHFIGEIANMTEKNIRERTVEILEIVKLTEVAKRKIGQYSGGMKQRLGIAVALFNKPEIVFLDEPTSALDPEGRMEILEFIKDLRSNGTTVFISTHILSDIERICDEVSILDKGQILISDNLESLKSKYIQPIFDIEFEKHCVNLDKILLNFKWVEKVLINENKASIYVNNLDVAKSELLKLLVKGENNILSYNLRKSNLEDIFIRLVNKNDNL
ncbi:ABC transporter ATP-binding protein [Clostridium sp. CM028]|uniref:ABC transporter ATP-binding protein n=1 Tax=unclassified Clostridium TaxID=2614128 RepID=UPI001C0C916D|nr:MULTISPECIES: ABC transporter ATP-binding protein [unclassified Clostridium]MBU3092832.1 ABC transporter ATP-binding protein [Clostridium sp. CF011]MBW9148271.1 ABC transporter ATP-binding protein [Clostridium sp. CM028]WAG71564.1 ABC transporter ATP-binding protein [Clostridium sp. CF011]WLC63312.1 ABC transporter ATP-binding protein [Clostridium sp. CM028]